MARVRINFGPDFCGVTTCDFCFRDTTVVKQEVSERDALYEAYEKYNYRWKTSREAAFITNKFKVQTPTQSAITIDNAAANVRCPRCGGGMIVRVNRNTLEKFLGCRSFPDCRGTRPMYELRDITKSDKNIEVENEPTIKGKVKVLKKEPKPNLPPKEEPKVVPEITLDSLLNRPVSKTVEDAIKTEGDVFATEFVGKQDSKERKA